MRRIILILIVLLACKLNVFASHIVGGEFELLHIQDFSYRLNMVLYFDEKGQAGAREDFVTVYIYRKSDNQPMGQYTLNKTEDALVPYSNVDCDNGELITSRLFYTNVISLTADRFDDPKGYYIAWERCCRNYSIDNIHSDVPNTGGISAGQTFYLEFPPVVKNGVPFVNSTPRLFPPLRDYGCVGKFFYTDFGGTDDDGDSLVYSMVTPYSTIDIINAYPISPNPGPYPDVVWEEGFGLDNIMGGHPDLAISSVGLLTVTPGSTGLFVFAVKCEEFRDGEKIGEMRRDFQMLVVSNCANNNPVVRAREKDKKGFYIEGNQLDFPYSATERCIEILVNDVPISGEASENVNIQVIPINFNSELEGINIDVTQNVPLFSSLDTARFEVCFPECPFIRGKPYKLGIIALDDACPLPALDTVIVTLNVEPPPNTPAYFAESRNGARVNNITKTVMESAGGNLSLDIKGFDAEDSVTFQILPIGFDLADVGMSFTEPIFGASEVATTFHWSYDCNADNLNFSSGRDVEVSQGIRKAFDILLILDDNDLCLYADPKQILMTMVIDFPDQTKPTVFETSKASAEYLKLNYTYGETINLNIKGQDKDGDFISLFGMGTNFNIEEVGASFTNVEGGGNPGVTSQFVWPIPCQYEAEMDSFRVAFYVEDLDDCQLTNIDTLNIDLILSPPVNTGPEIFLNSLNSATIANDSISAIVGEEIKINVRAIDIEGDSIVLDLFERSGSEPFTFEATSGRGSVQSTFSWIPTCADLTTSNGMNLTGDLELRFIALDKNCYEPKGSSYVLKIHVEDIDAGTSELLPPNFFTPNNGDEVNDFFGMYRLDVNTQELINILPTDNCAGQFERVIIMNRWGREVFQSSDRNFKWYGEGAAAGVYYYQLQFSNRQYQGSVTVSY
ncbi:MAG TPA: gliding motility-associated C-terminal domain-containing protein [Fulvivirga sp.]|nr:gliding motility-associated C-terminal domain-containing protein [Fulvivirga sp.]